MIQSSDVMGAAAGYSGPRGGPPHGVVRRERDRPAEIRPAAPRASLGAAERLLAVLAFARRRGRRAPARRRPSPAGDVERFAAAWAARRLRGDVQRADSPPSATACRRGAFTARLPATRSAPRRAVSVVTGQPAQGRRRLPRPGPRPTRAFGTVARRRACCRSPSAGDRLVARPRLPRAAPRRAPAPRDAAAAARRRCSRATARRSPRGADRTSPLAAGALDHRRARARSRPSASADARGARRARRRARSAFSGLERIFDERLLGTPGRRAAAPAPRGSSARVAAPGRRRCARRSRRRCSRRRSPPSATASAASSRSTRARARCSRFAGIALLRPAAARLDVQDPHRRPGALEAGLTSPQPTVSRRRPKADARGRRPRQRQRRVCGGTLVVVLRRVVQLGVRPARRAARRPAPRRRRRALRLQPRRRTSPGAATSTIPPADEIGDDLAVGSSAIGQGRVQATALQMAIVAATIGLRGRAPAPDARLRRRARPRGGHRARHERADRAHRRAPHAGRRPRRHRRARRDPGRAVAGKTGTAELQDQEAASPTRRTPRAARPQPARRPDRHRRLVLGLRPGRQRPPARSRSASSWSPRAPAATPPRRPRATSSRGPQGDRLARILALRRDREPMPRRAAPSRRRTRPCPRCRPADPADGARRPALQRGIPGRLAVVARRKSRTASRLGALPISRAEVR